LKLHRGPTATAEKPSGCRLQAADGPERGGRRINETDSDSPAEKRGKNIKGAKEKKKRKLKKKNTNKRI